MSQIIRCMWCNTELENMDSLVRHFYEECQPEAAAAAKTVEITASVIETGKIFSNSIQGKLVPPEDNLVYHISHEGESYSFYKHDFPLLIHVMNNIEEVQKTLRFLKGITPEDDPMRIIIDLLLSKVVV